MKAVIFDRDGVIIDSEFANVNASVFAFNELGIELTAEEKGYIVGRHSADYVEHFLKTYDFSRAKFREIHSKKYYELLDTAPLFSKTVNLIKRLHALNVKLALTTSSRKESTLKILEKAGIKSAFSVVVAYEDYTNRKPHPEPYLVTAKRLNVDPKDCVVIEDSFVGVESAKAAGMKCIALPNDHSKHQDFSKADIIIDSADKIDLELLNRL
jgi:HAD superfamily hydrolase (TIGR01509 family)